MTRPFVDRPVVDEGAARAAARDALGRWGVPGELELLRVGMNALYAVRGVDEGPAVVLRAGHATAPAAAAHNLAGRLLAAGIPTVVPVEGWASDVDGFAVTAWHRVRETRQAVSWEAVGAAVRAIHDLPVATVPDDHPAPAPNDLPWWDFDALMRDLAGDLDDAARAGLAAAIERNAWWGDAVGVGAVVCHGDVHPGNVIVSAGGPLLVDWDLLCTSAPAWDHAAMSVWADRWGGDPDLYRRFADGYGRSMADDPLTIALGELRNVAATLLRVRAGRRDPSAAAEAERRLRYWRGDPDASAWSPQ